MAAAAALFALAFFLTLGTSFVLFARLALEAASTTWLYDGAETWALLNGSLVDSRACNGMWSCMLGMCRTRRLTQGGLVCLYPFGDPFGNLTSCRFDDGEALVLTYGPFRTAAVFALIACVVQLVAPIFYAVARCCSMRPRRAGSCLALGRVLFWTLHGAGMVLLPAAFLVFAVGQTHNPRGDSMPPGFVAWWWTSAAIWLVGTFVYDVAVVALLPPIDHLPDDDLRGVMGW